MRLVSSGGLRLAEPLAALSMATDLARGQPAEQALRACLVATALAEVTGLRGEEASRVYYSTLLRFIGCTATPLARSIDHSCFQTDEEVSPD